MSRLDRAVNIDDLRTLARRRTPRAIFDYIDGGAEDELTLRANRSAWDRVLFRPRQAVRVAAAELRTTVLGAELSCPFLLAPIGYSRLFHPDGERGVARAAHDAGIGYVMSSFCGYRFDAIAAASKGPLWYQLYLAGGRAVVEATLAAAWQAGFKVLAITVDTNGPGMRERDLHNGTPELIGDDLLKKVRYLPQLLARPGWLAQFLGDRPDVLHYPNVILPSGPMRASDVRTQLANGAVDWSDLKWIRQAWPGQIVFKGVLTGDDARRAVDEGAAGVVVSNHGGRQLDSSFPTARALPEVIDAVGGRAVVLVDGGIRRGSHIIKALCMGAAAVLVGRAYAYGLAAAGQPGVARAIAILKADLLRTMSLLGCPSIAQLDASYIDRRDL
jgi:isopentenyl diphosphate isomerase/L-lactate dehydrogenase-like FMN-dependent dehydrogenase